jgi:hypothetical protein
VGRDLGTELEITKGLTADDQVVINPGERITEGGQVKVIDAQQQAAPVNPRTAAAN